MTIHRALIDIRSSLWFVPVACVVVGVVLSFGTILLDRHFDHQALPWSITGDPAAATAILSTIAASMVSLAALVLTITMVVVQLAMGQFSPRIVQRFLQDKPSQLAIGLFVATFVHAILALREVEDGGDGGGQVPGIAVVTAFVLVILSIAVLVVYVHHIGQALRVSALIEMVGDDTRELLDRLYPRADEPAEPETGGSVVAARESAVIVSVDHEALVAEAARAGCRLMLVPAVGEFVPAGAPLLRVQGDAGRLDHERLHRALALKLERTLDADLPYGLRLLVDIALRSLADSPLQDPTTAVQAIDRLHDVLRQLVVRPFPDGRYRDADGEVRLVVRTMSWEAYVRLAFEEIRMAGAGSPQVTRRLIAALADLRSVARADRVAVLDEQSELLRAAIEEALGSEREVEWATQADAMGIGDPVETRGVRST